MVFKSKIYKDEICQYVYENSEILNQMKNSKILITGAAGLIASYLIDIIMFYNEKENGNIKILALDKNGDLLKTRFNDYKENELFNILAKDIINKIELEDKIDYIIHAASNTSPTDYASIPVETINSNVIGNYRLLEYAKENKIKRYVFCSSVEVYGLNDNTVEEFDEKYSGYVDCNTLRANYPTSKRLCEAMCNSYSAEYNINYTIARIGRIYGPNVLMGDNKAPTQFIKKALNKSNIVLKSNGLQQYSYCYVGDCAMAILYIMMNGENCNAYNIADKNSKSTLKNLAQIIADHENVEVVFEEVNEIEKKGYSKVTKALLNTEKIESLNWKAKYNLIQGINETLNILKEEK